MILAQDAARPLIEFSLAPLSEDYGIPLAVMGILVVFLALVLVVMFITVLPRLVARIAPASMAGPAEVPIATDELSDEVVAVITAAVAATIHHPHRIVRIGGLAPGSAIWSLEGRMQHHQSHRIPHRDHR